MSTNKTTNYQLHLWEPGDDFLRKEFNENNVKVDAALKTQAEDLDTAASALAAYKNTNDAAVAGITQTIAGHGNCKVVCGSYAGTGTYGSANAITLNFDQKPMLVAVMAATSMGSDYQNLLMVRNSCFAYTFASYSGSACTVTWTDHTVSWYSAATADYQFNRSGYTYHYVALLAVGE